MAGKRGNKGARRKPARQKNRHCNREGNDPSDEGEERSSREKTWMNNDEDHPTRRSRPNPRRQPTAQQSGAMPNGGSSRKISSAKFVPLSLVMNKSSVEASSDPPGDCDTHPDHSRRIPTEDFSDAEHIDRYVQRENVDNDEGDSSSQYSYSSESEQNDDYHQDIKEDPKDREEEEEVEQYHHQRQAENIMQQQQQRNQHNQQYNHNDHAFTQFNIQPTLQPSHSKRQQTNNHNEDSNNSEGEEEEDEEAQPLFFTPSNNFIVATDKHSEQHLKGDSWGVDYLLARSQRLTKENERKKKQQFEIEQQRRRRDERSNKWWWQENYDDDEWDDVDFDDYHHSSFKCRRVVKYSLIFALTFVGVIAFLKRDELPGRKTTSSNNGKSDQSANHGSVPSSRWGHRFDDDDDAALGDDGDDTVTIAGGRNDKHIPKYHKHSHNKTHSHQLTPEQTALEQEKWEDYEMEVANVLAGASPGWDIHSKNGGGAGVDDTSDSNDNNDNTADGYTDHWVQYYDKSSQNYYYFHRETNATQWEKPLLDEGVILLGIAYGTGKEYVIEEGSAVESDNENEQIILDKDDEAVGDDTSSITEKKDPSILTATSEFNVPQMILDKDDEAVKVRYDTFSITEKEDPPISVATSDFNSQEVLDWYKDSYWRWNHPYRIAEGTEVWGGVDVPVFWRVPLSGATTVEQIITHCYHMIVAGTTGTSKDGKAVRSQNISEHLSVLTLDNGAHYLNIDMSTKEGIQTAKKAGLGQSGVADVILTRYLYNVAELFKDTGHTGRCFTILRHPIERAVAMFHKLKTNGVKAVSGMTIEQYANSSVAEDNWMTRMITDTMEGKVTQQHLQAAKEVIGRKCLVGLLSQMTESMERFAKFFRWEEIKSINTRHGDIISKEKDSEGKRKCFRNLLEKGVNRHQYTKFTKTSKVWKYLEEKNVYDIELYEYAEAMYHKQQVVYQEDE